jgi:hypothetical protein
MLDFPIPYLWQPSHDHLAHDGDMITYWLQLCHPDPNGFGGRA